MKKAEIESRILELKKKAAEKKRRLVEYEQNNKLEFFNTPLLPANPLQEELLTAWDDPTYKVFTYCGANRIGKTTILAVIFFSIMTGKWLWSNKKIKFPHNKPRRLRIVGQDWEKHVKTVLIPKLKEWWPKNRELHTAKNNVGAEAIWTDVATGSTLEIMSNKQESDLFEGWDGDAVGYDEPPKRDIRVACARGLIDRNGRELFSMTLLKEAWVHQEVINSVITDPEDPKFGQPDPTVYSIDGDIYSNVGYGITDEGVKQFIKTLTDDEIKARIYGKPSYLSGLVLPEFTRKTHLKERFQVPLNWLVDIAIDIHPRKRQAILFCATSPRNDKYLVEEIWDNGDGTWVAEQIVRRVTARNYRVNRIICDPLAKGDQNSDNTTYDKIEQVLGAHGMPLEVACKDKDSGILSTRNHLMGPNFEPSLFIFRDLIRTIKEIEGWMYDDKGDNIGKPSKKNDDMMENLYRIMLLETEWYPFVDSQNLIPDWLRAAHG